MWCLVDSKLCYVYDFDIYCSQNGGNEDIALARRGESLPAHKIVMNLIEGNQPKGHYIVMDNYFTSVGLFEDLH